MIYEADQYLTIKQVIFSEIFLLQICHTILVIPHQQTTIPGSLTTNRSTSQYYFK